MTTDLEKSLIRYINGYLYDKVYNCVFSEYRRNIQPRLLLEKSQINTFQTRLGYVELPTKDEPYFVYGISKDVFGGILIEPDTWISFEELNNTTKIKLKLFSNNGKVFPYGSVYIKEIPTYNYLCVAVSKSAYKKVVGIKFKRTNILIELYFDSDKPNDLLIYSNYITLDSQKQSIANLAKSSNTTMIYINGNSTTNINNKDDFSIGDYVDIIQDKNVLIDFTIDLMDTDQNRLFNSITDTMYKQIVHIPKELNPDNLIITHNTCDVYVYPKTTYNSVPKGLFIHRAQNSKSFSQITHNDFAIPLYLIEDYKTFIKSSELILRVQCRNHNKNNTLIRNNSYIDLLYTLPDNLILDFLEGTVNNNMLFWSANELENDPYVKLFNDTPESINVSNLSTYIEAIGYYQVLGLICPRVQRLTYATNIANPFIIPKPAIFYSSPVKSNVLIDGKKIDTSCIDYNGSVIVTIEDDVSTIPDGSTMIIEHFEYPNNNVYQITPNATNRTIEIPYETFTLYKKIEGSIEYKGVELSSTDRYRETEITAQIGVVEIIDGITTISFSSNTYGNTYIIQNNYATYELSKELDSDIENGNPLTIELCKISEGSINTQPICNIKDVIVYFNNKEIVKNIDYYLHQKTVADDIVFSQVIIQNINYLQDENNTVKVITLPNEIVEYSTSFLRNNYIPKEDVYWFDNLSMLSVDGLSVKNVPVTQYGYDTSEVEPRLGAIYGVRTIVSKTVDEFIASYYREEDDTRRQIVDNYLNSQINMEDDIIVIPYSHQIYSVYLATIIRDIINGTLVIGAESSPERLLNYLTDYEYLKDMDNVYLNDTVNMNYLDHQATYKDYDDVPIEMYTIIHQIVDLTLPDDPVKDRVE